MPTEAQLKHYAKLKKHLKKLWSEGLTPARPRTLKAQRKANHDGRAAEGMKRKHIEQGMSEKEKERNRKFISAESQEKARQSMLLRHRLYGLSDAEKNRNKVPWNKGKKLTNEETRDKLRLSHIGKTPWNKGRQKPDRRIRLRANGYLAYLVRKGKIQRPSQCEICKKQCVPCGHHVDYLRKSDVVWVCRTCHLSKPEECNNLWKQRFSDALGLAEYARKRIQGNGKDTP